MRSLRIVAAALAVTILFSGSASAQLCGDVNSDTEVNIIDLAMTLDYISGTAVPGFDVSAGDCDGVTGVTISDARRLAQYLFAFQPLNCSASGSYSFTAAPNDTIFIPRMLGIPDGTDNVHLLVYGSFSSQVGGIYLPLLNQGSSANDVFNFDNVTGADYPLIGGIESSGDTTVLWAVELPGQDSFDGARNLYMLNYDRVMAGTGDIAPDAVDRAGDWQIAIERGGDLYTPVIVYYDAADVALTISNMSLTFDAVSGQMAPDSAFVDFTSGGTPLGIGFTITRSANWIILDDFDGTLPWPTYTTPATVPISADATALGVLDYDGVVRVYYSGFDSWTSPVDSINVHFSVHPIGNETYPPGDVDCNGQIDIGDVMYLVYYIFLNGPAPYACQ